MFKSRSYFLGKNNHCLDFREKNDVYAENVLSTTGNVAHVFVALEKIHGSKEVQQAQECQSNQGRRNGTSDQGCQMESWLRFDKVEEHGRAEENGHGGTAHHENTRLLKNFPAVQLPACPPGNGEQQQVGYDENSFHRVGTCRSKTIFMIMYPACVMLNNASP